MQSVVLKNTDLNVSRLAFGTSRLHHLRWRRDRQALLDAAFDAGFTHFDTSPYYGFALAEHELGQLSAARSGQATVATKIGMYPAQRPARSGAGAWARKALGKLVRPLGRAVIDWSIDRASASLTASLRRLRRDHVDLLLLHEPDPRLIAADEFLRWLEEEQARGRVRHWGLAGNREQFAEWMEGHPLGMVRQVRDSLSVAAPAAQITFGYLSSEPSLNDERVRFVLTCALERHPGCILISTRRSDRLAGLANMAC
jgi:aryl-alcohol dehydrogenase-like predicted oxidoreductase